jgi:hypothetical protein
MLLLPQHASAQIEIAPSPSGSAAHYNALVVGGGSATPQAGATFEVNQVGSLPFTGTNNAGVFSIIAKDDALYHISIQNTAFSTDPADAWNCFQAPTGTFACETGTNPNGGASLAWLPATSDLRVNYGGFSVQTYLRAEPLTFATLPVCNATFAGKIAYITDSNTIVWGATAAAGGANKVGVSCNGTVWTVFSK